MKTFIEAATHFIMMRRFGDYRLCWVPQINKYSVIEFFDEEIELLDKNKIEIVVL